MNWNAPFVFPRVNITDGTTTIDFTVNHAILKNGEKGERKFRSEIYQTQEGDPQTPFSIVHEFGYGGAGSAHIHVPTMHDYSKMDARTLGELWPRPLRTNVDVTTYLNGTPRAIWMGLDGSGLPHMYIGGGENIAKVNRTTLAEEGGRADGGATVFSQPLYVNGVWLVPMGGADVYKRLTVVGAASIVGDTWADGPAGEHAQSFGFGFSGTFQSIIRGNSDGTISLAADNADMSLAASWAADYQIEKPGFGAYTILSLGRQVYVAGPNGLWGTDEFGQGVNLTPDVASQSNLENGRNAVVYQGAIMYPHRTGLYRVQGQNYLPVGLDEIPTWDGEVRGYVTAQAALGHWLYYALYDGVDSWLCCLRDRRQDEPGFGPYVIYTIEQFTNSYIGVMYIDAGLDGINAAARQPRLWLGWVDSTSAPTLSYFLSYYMLGRSGGPERANTNLTYSAGGTHYFAPNDGGFPNTLKTARSLEYKVFGDPTASRYLELGVDWDTRDRGGWTQIGADITAAGWGQRFFTPGLNDTGRTPRLVANLQSNSTTSPIGFEGGGITMRGMHRPLTAEALVYEFVLASEDQGDDMSSQGLTAEARWTQLQAWKETSTVLTLSDPYRMGTPTDTVRCQVVNVGRMEVKSDIANRPAYVAEVGLLVLEYS